MGTFCLVGDRLHVVSNYLRIRRFGRVSDESGRLPNSDCVGCARARYAICRMGRCGGFVRPLFAKHVGLPSMENQTMRKSIAAFCTRSVFFFALVTLLIVSTKSFAQSDTDEIKAVVDNYHAAVGAHDMSK